MIGDAPRDVTCAERAGVRGVLYTGGDLCAAVRGAINT